ncbi:MAG: hypothetical protein NW203_06445 [Hyphomonadaceae bacterium]|nr:hypothetical protein [Hyphomonadaceae bacterium]
MLDRSGLKPSQLATRAGMTAPNLYKFLDDDSGRTLRKETIVKLARAANAPPPDDLVGLAENEGRRFDYDPRLFATPDNAEEPRIVSFEITSDALRLAGFEPGDIAVVDTRRAPEPGQIVMAQVYDLRLGSADTVFRYFEPPYLVSASTEPDARKPILIDSQTVALRGVVIRQLRSRELAPQE